MWFVTPITVMIASTSPSAPTWMGTRKTSAGITTAPVIASTGWKLIAAQAVGGRLAWWTAWAMRNGAGRCISGASSRTTRRAPRDTTVPTPADTRAARRDIGVDPRPAAILPAPGDYSGGHAVDRRRGEAPADLPADLRVEPGVERRMPQPGGEGERARGDEVAQPDDQRHRGGGKEDGKGHKPPSTLAALPCPDRIDRPDQHQHVERQIVADDGQRDQLEQYRQRDRRPCRQPPRRARSRTPSSRYRRSN